MTKAVEEINRAMQLTPEQKLKADELVDSLVAKYGREVPQERMGEVAAEFNSGLMSIFTPEQKKAMDRSLDKDREMAKRVKCASNLRQIGQTMLLWSNDHRGAYPDDLGAMVGVPDGPELPTFICESSGVKIPADLAQKPRAEQVAWVLANSDYVYVAKGLKNSSDRETVLAYEKPDDHAPEGAHILWGDGRVTWENTDYVQKMIRRVQVGENPAK